MKIKPQVIVPVANWTPPAWASQAVTVVAGLAILLALPANAMLITVLTGAIGAGIGIAELRRHGGPDVPALPYVLED
jgi:hypothetical protein